MASRPSLGLYFTDTFVEISQLSADGKKLEKFNQINLPGGVIVNGEIKNQQGFVTVLEKLLRTAKPSPISKNQNVVIGVSDNLVFLREFVVPKLAGKEIDEAIDYQIRTLLPVLPAGVETDWQIIGRDEKEEIVVLLAALARKIIDSYIETCYMAGLNIIAIEPAVFANSRIIAPDQLEGKNILLVYMGDNFATFSFVTSGNPRFSDFMLGSEIQKKGDIVKTTESYVNFANSKYESRKVSEILLSGFNPQLGRIVDVLRIQKDPATLGRSRLALSAVADQGLLHTSHGLGLKTLLGGTSPNLLPGEYRLNETRNNYISVWKTWLTIMILLTMGACVGLSYLYRTTLANEAALNATKSDYERQLASTENVSLIKKANEINGLTDKLIILRNVTGGEEGVLREIAAVTPAGIKLTGMFFQRSADSIKLNDDKSDWMITGIATSRPLVLSFYKNLLDQPDFARGQLYFGSLEKEVGVSFRIASPKKP